MGCVDELRVEPGEREEAVHAVPRRVGDRDREAGAALVRPLLRVMRTRSTAESMNVVSERSIASPECRLERRGRSAGSRRWRSTGRARRAASPRRSRHALDVDSVRHRWQVSQGARSPAAGEARTASAPRCRRRRPAIRSRPTAQSRRSPEARRRVPGVSTRGAIPPPWSRTATSRSPSTWLAVMLMVPSPLG